MKTLLNDFIEKLPDKFRFDAGTLRYNPMEKFADCVSAKETVHSKIIAHLLNPAGDHQLGYGFLIRFIKELDIKVETNLSP